MLFGFECEKGEKGDKGDKGSKGDKGDVLQSPRLLLPKVEKPAGKVVGRCGEAGSMGNVPGDDELGTAEGQRQGKLDEAAGREEVLDLRHRLGTGPTKGIDGLLGVADDDEPAVEGEALLDLEVVADNITTLQIIQSMLSSVAINR